MLTAIRMKQPIYYNNSSSAVRHFPKGLNALSYEQEQPVKIEYIGQFPSEGILDPPRDYFFIVQFLDKSVGDPDREKGVIVYGDFSPDFINHSRFVKKLDRTNLKAVEAFSIKDDGREKVFQARVPLWLKKELKDTYDSYWRNILEKGRLARLAQAKTNTNTLEKH